MSSLDLAGIAIGGVAFLLTCFGLPDSWLFGLLALAVLPAAADQAYQENRTATVALLICAAAFAAVALRAAFTTSRVRRPQ